MILQYANKGYTLKNLSFEEDWTSWLPCISPADIVRFTHQWPSILLILSHPWTHFFPFPTRRILQNFKQLRRISFYGLFATWPPISAMKMTWPFILEHLPKLEHVSFCERRHFLAFRGEPGKSMHDDTLDCRFCSVSVRGWWLTRSSIREIRSHSFSVINSRDNS